MRINAVYGPGRWLASTMVLAALFCVTLPTPARGDSAADTRAAQALAVFQEKCVTCHSPQAKKVKKFDYILDLPKLAANPKYVIPGDPDHSLLYTQLAKDEMPPEESEIDPLNVAQKEIVKKWVAGLPPTPVAVATTTTAPAHREPRPFMTRFIEFAGKFHPLAAHTPIAVLMAAAIAEMLYLRHPAPALTGAARFCAVLGAMGAIATAALGWAMAYTLASKSPDETQQLDLHRWAGTIAGAASIPIAILGEWGSRRAHREGRKWHGFSRWAFRISIFGIAGLVGFTAHLGGLLVWGADLFNFPKF